jgi:AcrR family transcriptional regulator
MIGKKPESVIAKEPAVPDEGDEWTRDAASGGGNGGPSRRRFESRRKLMAAARKLFVERGYHDTRPQDISREAGVGHGTFYLHFQDKLDCFLAFADEAVEELDAFLIKPAGNMDIGSTEEIISKNLRAIMIYSDAHPGVLPAATTDLTVLSTGDIGNRTPAARWAETWAGLLDELKKKGEAAADIDSRLTGHFIVGAIRQGGIYAANEGMDQEQFIASLTRFFVRALKAR